MDCTMGEQIVLRFTSETIELCEPDSIESTEIFLKAITAHSRIVLDKKRTSQELLVFVLSRGMVGGNGLNYFPQYVPVRAS